MVRPELKALSVPRDHEDRLERTDAGGGLVNLVELVLLVLQARTSTPVP